MATKNKSKVANRKELEDVWDRGYKFGFRLGTLSMNDPKQEQKWIDVEGRVNLAGVKFTDYQLVAGPIVGKVVQLVGEPRNQYDNMAIRVQYQGVKIGYIPAKSVLQSELWNYHNKGFKCIAVVTQFSKTSQPWCAVTVQCKRMSEADSPKQVEIPEEVEFDK